MSFRNDFRCFIVLLSFVTVNSIIKGYDKKIRLCVGKQLILLPTKRYPKCNAVVSIKDVRTAPNVRIPDATTLGYGTYVLIMIDPDRYNHKLFSYVHWLKSYVAAKHLAQPNGVTADEGDNFPYEAPLVKSSTHRIQFLLYKQNKSPIVLLSHPEVSRIWHIPAWESKNAFSGILMSYQYNVTDKNFTHFLNVPATTMVTNAKVIRTGKRGRNTTRTLVGSASFHSKNWGSDYLLKMAIICFAMLLI